MNPTIPPGVFDIVPEEVITDKSQELWRASHIWQHVESIIRQTAKDYGFKEIRTPVFERTELFQRGVGEGTDIVSKEMYTFLDKGNRSMSLRPEGTAAAMRAFLDNSMQQAPMPLKLFYISPMFRYERAQAGRYRQHHQFGAEVIGSSAPEQDVEIIDLLHTLYLRLGLKNLKVSLNSIGDAESRANFRTALVAYMNKHLDALSADSKVRLEQNPLRILDSKDPGDRAINANAPSILDFLNEESRDHFNAVQQALRTLDIPFEINPLLVRGLDYYNKTVFEITSGVLGAQNSIAGGGRYDGLLKTIGAPDLPAIGFGTGIERIIQTMLKQEAPIPSSPAPEVLLIAMGDEARTACFKILHKLRMGGIAAAMDFSGRKLNKVMQYANQINAATVAIIGDNELATGQVELKDMATGNKRTIPLDTLVNDLCAIKAESNNN